MYILRLCAAFIFFCLACPPWSQANQTAYAATSDKLQKILFLPSYNFDSPGVQWFNKGFITEMGEQKTNKVAFSIENLQLAAHSGDEAYFAAVVESLRIKYAKDKPDLLVAQHRQSFDFLLRYGRQIFGNVPVVFAGMEMEGYGDFEIPARFSGVVAIFNARRSIDLILQLQPRIGTIYVVSGAGTAEKMMLANTLAQGLQYQDRLQFVALSQLPFEQMLARVAEISGNAAILFLSMQIDVTGKLPEPSVAAGEIGRVAQVPVYGMFDTYSGSGITGGFLIDHEKLGRRAADIAIPILQGQAPTGNFSNEPIGENSFDWRQLKRWGIDERSLPAGSRVEFKEFSPWELYKWQLIGGICFIVLPSLLVVILLVNRSRRKQVEEELREANENLEDRLAILTRSLGNAKESSTSQNEEVVAVNEELITQYEEKA